MTVNHDVVGSSPTGGAFYSKPVELIFFCLKLNYPVENYIFMSCEIKLLFFELLNWLARI